MSLRKPTLLQSYLPYKDLMLLQVKGRRHVQTRLVEPTVNSINRGDNYLLVTPSTIYNYIGEFSNIIEQSRAADVASYIQQTKDMGCKSGRVVTMNSKENSTRKDIQEFWKLLKSDENSLVDAGHPEEDELFEMRIIGTNMIYEFCNDELVPYTEYWGSIPKIEMLQESKIIVFDFGTEMYVWSGKTSRMEDKNKAFKLAQELWNEGFNYEDCSICPVTVASVLGAREEKEATLKATSRPEWGLFAKITQHTETILFKEKFFDWPDETRLIRVKNGPATPKTSESSYDIQPCDAQELFEKPPEPDLVAEGTHLGRGSQYFDEEFSRLFEFETNTITAWRITENSYEKIDEDSVGQFYNGESYILRWRFRMTVKGRELSGKPSKHLQSGRDRTIYFFWQGENASRNEQGAAALLTVELDSESAPQIRVTQGHEPAAFLKLFKGAMVVHDGKRDTGRDEEEGRLYVVGGEIEDEVFLTEVPCKTEQLRSRTSFVLVDASDNSIAIWHGCKSSDQTRKVCREVVEKICRGKPPEFSFDADEEVSFKEVEEGDEDEAFEEAVGLDRGQYLSLLGVEDEVNHQVRLFHFSSVSGSFKAAEILCQHSSSFVTPYPVHQADLYSAHQPGIVFIENFMATTVTAFGESLALFLLDNGCELWLWQGWWPEREEDDADLSDQTGSGAVRWQLERKAAMQTAIGYWTEKNKEDEEIPAYLVWAGFEPKEFTNLFPTWCNREDIRELNAKVGEGFREVDLRTDGVC